MKNEITEKSTTIIRGNLTKLNVGLQGIKRGELWETIAKKERM